MAPTVGAKSSTSSCNPSRQQLELPFSVIVILNTEVVYRLRQDNMLKEYCALSPHSPLRTKF